MSKKNNYLQIIQYRDDFYNIDLAAFNENIKGDNIYNMYISHYKSYKNFINKKKKKYNNDISELTINPYYLPALFKYIKKFKNIKNDICKLIIKPYNMKIIEDNLLSYVFQDIIQCIVY